MGIGRGMGEWGGEDAGKKAVVRDCHRIQERGAVSPVGETTAKKQDTQEQFPPRTQGPPISPTPQPHQPRRQDSSYRKTTGTKILENRNCWDYKGIHFIHTNWSVECPCESLTVVSKFLGKKPRNKTPTDGRSFSSPFGLSQHFFSSFRFGTAFPFFFVPLNHWSVFWVETDSCTMSSWRLHSPPGLDIPGGNHSFSSLLDRTCVCFPF